MQNTQAVLLKTTKLNEEEWAAIKKHPEIGAEILSKSHHLNELKDIVLHHPLIVNIVVSKIFIL